MANSNKREESLEYLRRFFIEAAYELEQEVVHVGIPAC